MTSRMEGDVCVAIFNQAKILDEAVINEVGTELRKLVDQHQGGKLLIDFNNVTFMSSAMIGKVVFLEKECRAKGVDLRLCSINPMIMEAITMLNLDKLLEIYGTVGEALAAYES